MDTYKLKLKGIVEIQQPLNDEEEYNLKIPRACIKDLHTKPNHDGEHTLTYTVEPTSHIEIEYQGIPLIKSKDKKSFSQRLRGFLYFKWNENFTHIDNELFYEGVMKDIIANGDEIIEILKNKKGTFLNKL